MRRATRDLAGGPRRWATFFDLTGGPGRWATFFRRTRPVGDRSGSPGCGEEGQSGLTGEVTGPRDAVVVSHDGGALREDE